MRVVVVEDQQLLLDSLVRLINEQDDMEVVAQARDANLVDGLVERFRPELVLMDVCTLNRSSGIEAAARLRQSDNSLKIVLMTAMPDISFLEEAKEAGVNSFIYKDIESSQLLEVLRSTALDYCTFPNQKTLPELGYNRFNSREVEVLRLTCAGMSRREIAEQLSLSENTVKAVISSLLTKTGFTSIAKLAIHAISTGFIVVMEPTEPDFYS